MASEILKRKRRIKTIVRKFDSFEDEEKAEIEYWRNLPLKEKLKVLDEIQTMHLNALFPKGKRFQKVVRVVTRGED